MGQKILVADDSLTVQKVVSITLASYDYELVEIRDEILLNEQLIKGGANLLLLDLNLSEGKSGYELAKEIRQKQPDLPIILLLGTFDSVDEAAFEQAGINDRIVKPFESNAFIQKVQALLEASPEVTEQVGKETVFSGETETNFLNTDVEDVTPVVETVQDSGDDWVVDSPAPVDKSSDSWDSYSIEEEKTNDNALEASLEGWGMNVPGPIGSSGTELEMAVPEVISENAITEIEAGLDIVHEEENKTPEAFDLDYPDVGELEETSSDDLVSAVGDEENADDFWAADVELQEEEKPELTLEDEDEEEDFFAEPDVEQNKEVIQTSISLEPLGDPRGNEPFEIKPEAPAPSSVNTEEIVEKILAELKPTLNELVEKHCKEIIENVAWQIIPDLAENLIRNEIKEIKESSL